MYSICGSTIGHLLLIKQNMSLERCCMLKMGTSRSFIFSEKEEKKEEKKLLSVLIQIRLLHCCTLTQNILIEANNIKTMHSFFILKIGTHILLEYIYISRNNKYLALFFSFFVSLRLFVARSQRLFLYSRYLIIYALYFNNLEVHKKCTIQKESKERKKGNI